MSRDLTTSEKQTFVNHYGTGEACEACGNADVTIRIWEKWGADSKQPGGDIGPGGIIGAVIICENCGHGQTVPRSEILKVA